MKIENSTFLITGGASGLGEAVVRAIVAKNGKCIIFDMSQSKGESLISELSDKNIYFHECDVTSEKSVKDGLAKGLEKFGALHGVLNCAGVGFPRRVLSSSGSVCPLDDFTNVVNINLIGTFNVLRLGAAVMAKQAPINGERGVIINVASIAAFDGQVGQASYSASKAAVIGMALPIAREFAPIGIRVLTIAPGLFKTPMMAALPEKARKSLEKQVPFPSRLGDPAEFAQLAVFMIENQYMNAEVVRIDGAIRMAAM